VRAHIEPQLEENRLAQSVLMSFFLKKESKSNVAGNKRQNKKEVNLKGKKGLRRSVGCFVVGGMEQ
jgi:hypothetical protein